MAIEIKCGHHPWSTQIWLLLAVLSNANGSILFFATFLDYPYPFIITAVYIMLYRFFFYIARDDIPIAIELVISYLCQELVVYKSWEFAINAAFFLNMTAYNVVWCTHYAPGIFRLKKLNPERQITLKELIRPLSEDLWFMSNIALYFWQSFFLVFVWFSPFEEENYLLYQLFLGCYLVSESVMFLKCFWEMVEKTVKDQKQS